MRAENNHLVFDRRIVSGGQLRHHVLKFVAIFTKGLAPYVLGSACGAENPHRRRNNPRIVFVQGVAAHAATIFAWQLPEFVPPGSKTPAQKNFIQGLEVLTLPGRQGCTFSPRPEWSRAFRFTTRLELPQEDVAGRARRSVRQ